MRRPGPVPRRSLQRLPGPRRSGALGDAAPPSLLAARAGEAVHPRSLGSRPQRSWRRFICFLLLAVGQAIAAQDIGKLLRSTFVALPVALLLTFAAVTLVEVGLAVTDWMSAVALRGAGGRPAGQDA